MVTFALYILRKKIRFYPLLFFFAFSFETYSNHYFNVLTITKYGHLPKYSFKMSLSSQLLENSVIASSSLQITFLKAKILTTP